MVSNRKRNVFSPDSKISIGNVSKRNDDSNASFDGNSQITDTLKLPMIKKKTHAPPAVPKDNNELP